MTSRSRRGSLQQHRHGYAGTVHFTSNDPGCPTLPADSTLTIGVGVFTVTLKTSGNQTITATDTVTSSITGSQVNIAIDPGPLDHIVIAPDTATRPRRGRPDYTAEGFDSGDNDRATSPRSAAFTIERSCPMFPIRCSAVTVGDHTVTGHRTRLDGHGDPDDHQHGTRRASTTLRPRSSRTPRDDVRRPGQRHRHQPRHPDDHRATRTAPKATVAVDGDGTST